MWTRGLVNNLSLPCCQASQTNPTCPEYIRPQPSAPTPGNRALDTQPRACLSLLPQGSRQNYHPFYLLLLFSPKHFFFPLLNAPSPPPWREPTGSSVQIQAPRAKWAQRCQGQHASLSTAKSLFFSSSSVLTQTCHKFPLMTWLHVCQAKSQG